MTNKKKSILTISLFDNVFNVQWECLNQISDKFDFEFILLFRDKKIENFLKEKNIIYHTIDYKLFERSTKYLPFFRIILREFYYFFSYKIIDNRINTNHDFLFINDNSFTVGKYFLQKFNKKDKPSFLYEYGVGLFNPLFFENIKHHTHPYNGFIKNFIYKYEEKIRFYFYNKKFGITKESYPYDIGVSHLLVLNEISKKNASNQYPNLNIIEVGNVQYSKYRNININDNQYILILLSNGYQVAERYGFDKDLYFINLKKLLSYLYKTKKQVILKHHPNDNLYLYESLKKEFSLFEWVRHNDEKSNQSLIVDSTLIISTLSTLVMEAMYIKKPVLFYKFYNEKDEDFHFYNDIFNKLPVFDINQSMESNFYQYNPENINETEYNQYIESKLFKEKFTSFLLNLENL